MTSTIVRERGAVMTQAREITSDQHSDSAQLMHVIEHAARDPSVDIDKLERLISLRQVMLDRHAQEQFALAMNAAQSEITPIAADATNSLTRSKYASYFALDRALRPIYSRHGFSLSFDTADSTETIVRVLCYVSHASGHTRTHKVDMPADGKGAKGGDVMTKTHATGSAFTYGQRYLLRMIFNIAIGGDDDGNAAGTIEPTIDGKQADWLRACLTKTGSEEPRFLRYISQVAKRPIERLEEIPVRCYQMALDALAKKNATRAQSAAKEDTKHDKVNEK